MFPLQRGKELVIKFSNSPHQQQHQISEDLILDDYDSLGVNDSDKIITSNQPKNLIYGAEKSAPGDSNEHMKKIVHRDIERQRRQEMATLHASLRSLLPLEFIQGKRSISDHMNEAVNYIKYMQENIKELGAKRDELKKLSTSKLENHATNHAHGSFTIHENNGIVRIEITSCSIEERFTLSKLLQLLLEEGLEVVNCLSTEVNGRLFHSVQCEVNKSKSVNLSVLRRKVADVFPSYTCCE
ncbi:hypothetical protein TanjilG_07368 [Lupinus angustifolius]|uniref:BHLH domain-containing protein n=1 Tax=Lupinus angustifolius TaxID=3871 RepID=A0A394BJS0_LUPAN|nr:PREDICTED: transcription factor bHLH118-like [Lupinus angustifolius]OIV98932.1 hypothetical protein TanjilG_07367 [Lupinus angustifolius]OIV98933.1 hypothetical protein TanjilG_07368 [Lupinus angustifolius]